MKTVRTFGIPEFILAVRGRRLTHATAAIILDGPEGFVERGLVARVPGGRYIVTEKGARFSRSVNGITRAVA